MAEENLNELQHCYENLIVVDTGANLTNKKFIRDLDSVLQRSKDSGIVLVFFFLVLLTLTFSFKRPKL
jgi:hypothetical protein